MFAKAFVQKHPRIIKGSPWVINSHVGLAAAIGNSFANPFAKEAQTQFAIMVRQDPPLAKAEARRHSLPGWFRR
jgi:hypothetical protein